MAKSNEKIDIARQAEINDNLGYLEQGLAELITQRNPGFVGSFTNHARNEEGLYIDNTGFKKCLKKLKINLNIKDVPPQSILQIKYSPIALFKKWIFVISNHKFLKVSERKKEFTAEFYLYHQKKSWVFQQLVTNVAHEKFLLSIYDKIDTAFETSVNFTTFFKKDKRLVVFKNYATEKTSAISATGMLIPGKLHPVKLSVARDTKGLKYRISINRGRPTSHTVSLPGTIKIKTKDPIKKEVKTFKSTDDYRAEVLELVKSFNKTGKSTNKFANIALGRINKIPVLINLSTKYKNKKVKLEISRKNELQVFDPKDLLIKAFVIAKNPKSNWLEKK